MKKTIRTILLILLLFPFCVVKANNEGVDKFQFNSEENIEQSKTINGSSLQVGNKVVSNSEVRGIEALAGNSIKFNGVSEYGVILGNVVELSGTIEKDGVVLGNTINFNESFNSKRDLFIFGNEVVIYGNFERDVVIYAKSVIVKGEFHNDLNINASTIKIEENALVSKKLTYNKDADFVNDSKKINSIILTDELIQKNTFANTLVNTLISLAGVLVVYIVFVLLVPSLFEKLRVKSENLKVFNIFSILGMGGLILITVPIVFLLLVSLVFGVPLAMLLLVSYIIVIYLTKMFVGFVVGNYIWTKFIKKEKNTLLIGLLGISFIYLLLLVPYINDIVTFFSLLFGIGLLGYLFKKA